MEYRISCSRRIIVPECTLNIDCKGFEWSGSSTAPDVCGGVWTHLAFFVLDGALFLSIEFAGVRSGFWRAGVANFEDASKEIGVTAAEVGLDVRRMFR